MGKREIDLKLRREIAKSAFMKIKQEYFAVVGDVTVFKEIIFHSWAKTNIHFEITNKVF